jgi:hypothetical protein
MFALCGNQTRDHWRSRRVFTPLRHIRQSAINPLVAFYDGRKRQVLFFYFVPDTIRDQGKESGGEMWRNPLVAFYTIHKRKGEVHIILFRTTHAGFYHTRHNFI